MNRLLVYTSIFFSLGSSFAAYGAPFTKLIKDKRYMVDGEIPVEVLCTFKNGPEIYGQSHQKRILVPNMASGAVGGDNYNVGIVELKDKSVITQDGFDNYKLIFLVPGLGNSNIDCVATLSIRQPAGSPAPDVTALANY